MLSADIYSDTTGKRWSAVVRRHPKDGGDGVVAWERHDMRSEYNATSAMESAWQRLK